MVCAAQRRCVGIVAARAGHHGFILGIIGRADMPHLIDVAGTDLLDYPEFGHQRMVIDVMRMMGSARVPGFQITLLVVAEAILVRRPAGELVNIDVLHDHVICVAVAGIVQVTDVLGDSPRGIVPVQVGGKSDSTLAVQARIEGDDQQAARHRRGQVDLKRRRVVLLRQGKSAGKAVTGARQTSARDSSQRQFQKLPAIHEAVSSRNKPVVLHAFFTCSGYRAGSFSAQFAGAARAAGRPAPAAAAHRPGPRPGTLAAA